MTSITDANGNATTTAGDGVIRMTYDELNRPTEVDYPGSESDVTMVYDSLSRVRRMTDRLGSETYRFDDIGRLTRVARGDRAFSYAYDAVGNLASRRYPDGSRTSYGYDADNRLTSSNTPDGQMSYAYDAASNLTKAAYPNGFVESVSYDPAGRVDELSHTRGRRSLFDASYSYDGLGNLLSETANGATTSYGYDELHRLTETCFDGPCEDFLRYAYDSVGNRTEEVTPQGTTTFAYDAGDRLTSSSGADGETTYEHDDNGNLIRAGERTYTYDETQHLAEVRDGTDSVSYTYDGAGRRVTRDTATETTRYTWDLNHAFAQLAFERTGDEVRRYSYGQDLVSVRAGGSPSYFHHDRLGSVVGQTSPSGSIEARLDYSPYGESAGNNQNPMRFTGEYLDDASGLYHLRARDYDPELGRFLQPDPLPLGPTAPYVSSYAYAYNRPTFFTDPSGMFGLGDITDAVGSAADAVGDAAGDVADFAGETAGAVGDFVVEHRHDIVDVAIGFGAAAGLAACGLTVVCGVAVGAGALAAGVGAHYGSDAITGQESGSFGEYLTRSGVSTGYGLFCGATLGAGCGGQLAAKSGLTVAGIPRLSTTAANLSLGQVWARGGAGIIGRGVASLATGVPGWLQTAPYESTSSSAGGK